MVTRIPFGEAITEPLLFKAAFEALSRPQQMILKAIYGLPLDAQELRYWSAFNGCGRYDALGYLIDVKGEFPYTEGQEFEDVTLIIGRRGGKSQACSSFVVAYEALCGGHRQELSNQTQDPIFLQVAQDLATAKANLRQFIIHYLEMGKVGAREMRKGSQTADSVRLSTGLITVGPPTIKLRSQAIAVCAMDELAVWPKDRESANPDTEVEIAVRPAMAQFPHRKLVKTSTPWTEEGLLWDAALKGTQGFRLTNEEQRKTSQAVLVLRAPTAAMENPKVPKSYLIQERAKDANAFSREYLAEFAKSVTGFLSPLLLRQSVTPRVEVRPPERGVQYVATMDPAFRRDAFAFCVGHLKDGVFILDYLDAPRGTREQPLSPALRMATVSAICREYGVGLVTADQFHDVSLQELGTRFDLIVEPYLLSGTTKQQVWGDFVGMLNQGKIRLLDDPQLLEEFLGMERTLTLQGHVQIYGKRDDRATVVALCVHKALQYGERRAGVVVPEVPLSLQIKRAMRSKKVGAWWNQ